MMAFMKSKYVYWISILSIGTIFILGYFNQVSFGMFFAVCAALFWIIQRVFFEVLDKGDDKQKQYCYPIGRFSLLPSLGMIAIGVYILSFPHINMSPQVSYAFIIASSIPLVFSISQIIILPKNKTAGGRFWKLATINMMLVLTALSIVLILYIAEADDSVMLSSMTTIIFGSIAFLLSINMVLVSTCGYKSTFESVRVLRRAIKSRKLIFTRMTIIKDGFLVAGKALISIVSTSFFMFANALYSTGMGIARFIAVKMHKQEGEKQISSYRLVGIIISISSVCYVLYSIRLFWGGVTNDYSMYIALIIALYTFVEFGINIREAFRLRKSKALEAKALRAVSFASTLICFVLTQTAIMSFAAVGDNSFVNALSGVTFGILAAIIGIYVIVDSYLHKRIKNP